MSIRNTYSDISDNDLDEKVASLKHHYPNAGYRMASGLLLEEGIRLQQRECMHRVDPLGVAIRWGEAIRRRQYNVLSPLSLWHLDGNHKLIRCDYYMYIHVQKLMYIIRMYMHCTPVPSIV